MRMLMPTLALMAVLAAGCGSTSDSNAGSAAPDDTTGTTADAAIQDTTSPAADLGATTDPGSTAGTDPSPDCGHDIDPSIVEFGFNEVLDDTGAVQMAQGRPLQEGWTLSHTDTEITAHNEREYGRIAAWMMPIRDAIQCDLDSLSRDDWLALTDVLTLNGIKTAQDLSGTPKEQVYSTEGLYDHLAADGEDYHATLKYLEEAELELKCLAFADFDFTNPEGDDHCAIHGLTAGTLQVPVR